MRTRSVIRYIIIIIICRCVRLRLIRLRAKWPVRFYLLTQTYRLWQDGDVRCKIDFTPTYYYNIIHKNNTCYVYRIKVWESTTSACQGAIVLMSFYYHFFFSSNPLQSVLTHTHTVIVIYTYVGGCAYVLCRVYRPWTT